MFSATTFAVAAQLSFVAALSYPNSSQSTSLLWDNKPATVWNQSYVIGNGYLGASTGGIPSAEILAMNHEAFWSGGPLNRTNQDALRYMPGLQSEIVNGHPKDAESLGLISYTGQPVRSLLPYFPSSAFQAV